MVPWVISKDPSDFEAMIQFLLNHEQGEDAPKGWVPTSTYWLINENHQIIGVVNIRHKLTDKLLSSGGHIGYGIRPSERRKGFATRILALAVEEARGLGIDKVLVVCDEGNVGSEKVIRKNGGTQDQNYMQENGKIILRFWIYL